MAKSPSLRRIQADVRELSIDPSDRYHAAPLENDMFEWHFTIRGADGTDFEGGYYHGRILLPAEYPFKPPNIVFLTPSGRFETNVKVCLSFSAYHPELWQPAWGIRLILEALVSFLPTKGDGAIGALDWTSEERKRLAKKSVDYVCPVCGKCSDILRGIEKRIAKKKAAAGGNYSTKSKFQKEIEQLHALQIVAEGKHNDDGGGEKEESVKVCATEEMEDKDDSQGEINAAEKVGTESESEIKKAAMENTAGVESFDSSDSIADLTTENISDEIMSEKDPNVQPSEDVTAIAVAPVNDDEEQEGGEQNKMDGNNNDNAECNETNVEVQEEASHAHELETIGNEDEQNQILESPLLSDPVLHVGIAIFGIIVYLLIRKLGAVAEEMRDLEAQFRDLES